MPTDDVENTDMEEIYDSLIICMLFAEDASREPMGQENYYILINTFLMRVKRDEKL